MIDMRPRHANQCIELVSDEQAELVLCYDDQFRMTNDTAADDAIAEVIDTGLFALSHRVPYTYAKYDETSAELMEYFLTRNPPVHHPAKIIEHFSKADENPNTKLRFTNDMHLNCYRKRA